jgi:hypothetical protein
MTVGGSPPAGLEPYDYGIHIPVVYPGTMDVSLSSCQPGAESLEGSRQSVTVGGDPLAPGGTYFSQDGLEFAGTDSDSSGGASWEVSWSLAGS